MAEQQRSRHRTRSQLLQPSPSAATSFRSRAGLAPCQGQTAADPFYPSRPVWYTRMVHIAHTETAKQNSAQPRRRERAPLTGGSKTMPPLPDILGALAQVGHVPGLTSAAGVAINR